MTTMKEVASRAGVSAATVSRVLSGTAGVSDDLRERVEAAIAAAGYRPNRLARGLRRQSAMVWGLLISDIQNTFFTGLVRAVEDIAHKNGYSLVLCNSDEDLEKEAHYLDILISEQVSGLLITPEDEHRTSVHSAVQAAVPFVAVDRRLLGHTADTVLVDNHWGAREAVEHLIENGARRVALLLGDERVTAHRERYDGYRAALARYRIPLDERLVLRAGTHSNGATEAVRRLFTAADRPDALFITNNQLTIRGLPALYELGLTAPHDLLVASFDDLPLASVLNPGLTVVEQPTYDLGRRAAELLLARLQAPQTTPREVLLAPRLIVRGTSVRP